MYRRFVPPLSSIPFFPFLFPLLRRPYVCSTQRRLQLNAAAGKTVAFAAKRASFLATNQQYLIRHYGRRRRSFDLEGGAQLRACGPKRRGKLLSDSNVS
jgi:hypothetical protein